MKKISLIFTFVVLCVALFALTSSAASFTRGPENDQVLADDVASIELISGSTHSAGYITLTGALDGNFSTWWGGPKGSAIKITFVNEWEITQAEMIVAANWCGCKVSFYAADDTLLGSLSYGGYSANTGLCWGGDATNADRSTLSGAVGKITYGDEDKAVKYVVYENTGDKWGYLPMVAELILNGRERVPSEGCDSHEFAPVYTVEPTCTTTGTVVNTCTKCGAEEAPATVDALGHNMGEYTVKVPATCDTAAILEYACTRCGEVIERPTHIKDVTDYADIYTAGAQGAGGYTTSHQALYDNNMESYLHASGGWYVESWIDLDMPYYITSVTVWTGSWGDNNSWEAFFTFYYQAPGSDEWVAYETTKAAGVIKAGEKYEHTLELDTPVYADAIKIKVDRLCSFQGQAWEAEVAGTLFPETAPLGHTWEVTEVNESACDVVGYTVSTCTVCGDTKSDNYTKALSHNWANATCLAPKTCTVCEVTEGDALAHEYVAGEPAENGAVTYTCKNGCNDAYVINNAAINGTYYADAMTSFVFENGVLTANGETFNYTFNETTGILTVEGLDEGVIAYVNGKIVFRGKVELHTHDNSLFTEVTEPTCSAEGYTTYICQFCGPLYDADRVPATGHDWNDADCVTAKTCSVCGATEGEALGHNINEWAEETVIVDATCSSTGTMTGICLNCQQEVTVVLPIDSENHADMMVWNDDYTIGICEGCDVVKFSFWSIACEDYGITADVYASFIDIYSGDEMYSYEFVVDSAVDGVYNITITVAYGEDPFELVNTTATISDEGLTAGAYVFTAAESSEPEYDEFEWCYGIYVTADETIKFIVDAGIVDVYANGDYVGTYTLTYNDDWNLVAVSEDGETITTWSADEGAWLYGDYMLYTTETEPENPDVPVVDATELEVGDTTIELIGGTVPYIVSVPGSYTLTIGENTVVLLVTGPYSAEEITDTEYTFILNEGDSIRFDIGCPEYGAGTATVTLEKEAVEEPCTEHVYDLANAVTNDNIITIACTNNCGAVATITVNGTMAQAGFDTMMQQAIVSVYAPGYGMLSAATSEGSSCLLITNPRLPAQPFNTSIIANIDGMTDTYVIVPQFSSTDAAPSITITYEALKPATIVEGKNTVDTSKGDTKVQFVVVESGKYNFVLNADAMILTEYGAVGAWAGPFEYEAGDVIEIIVMPYGAPSIDITVEKIVEHTHTEVAYITQKPLPSNGHTAKIGKICSECNEVTVEPVEVVAGAATDAKFKVNSAGLALGEDVSMNYTSTLVAGGNKNEMYMVFVIEGEEFIVTESKASTTAGRYTFNFAGLKSYQFAENISAYVYAIENGSYVVASQDYSVYTYVSNQLKKTTISGNLRTLLSSVLAFGEASQVKVGTKYNDRLVVSVLANRDGLNLTTPAFEGIDESYKNHQSLTGDRTQGYDWKSGTLSIGSSIFIQLKFTADSTENLMLNFEVDGRSFQVDASELTKGTDGRYVVLFQVKVLENDKPVTCTFIKDGEQVGSTLTYSVYRYLCANYNTSDTKAGNLMKAIYTYTEASKAYSANPNQ